jgi:hypothetical protein
MKIKHIYMKYKYQSLTQNRVNKHDLPTPESPIRMTCEEEPGSCHHLTIPSPSQLGRKRSSTLPAYLEQNEVTATAGIRGFVVSSIRHMKPSAVTIALTSYKSDPGSFLAVI